MGLTRKEIQQDRIRTILTDIYQWAMANQTYLVGGLAVAVLLMLAAYGWNNYQQGQNRAAQAAFSEAVELFHGTVQGEETQGQDPSQTPPAGQKTFASKEERDAAAKQAMEAVVKDYSGTPVVPWARYYIALLEERAGNNEQARQILSELGEDSQVPEVRSLAIQRLAADAQQQGQYQQAADYWKSLLDNPASRFPIQGAVLELARCYEKSGDLKAALEQYRRVQDEFPTSQQARDAKLRIDALAPQVEKPEAEGETAGPEASPEPESSDPSSGR